MMMRKGGRTRPRDPNLGMPDRRTGGMPGGFGSSLAKPQGSYQTGPMPGGGGGMGFLGGMGGGGGGMGYLDRMGGGAPQHGRPGPRPGGGGAGGGGADGWAPNRGWQDRGFESKDAAQSVNRQYGLVQQPGGGWGRPDSDFLQRQMDASGWGIEDQRSALNNGTPVAIGGMRWLMGGNGMDFTGQASDVPFGNRPVGQAYNSAQPYGRTRPSRRTRTFGQVM